MILILKRFSELHRAQSPYLRNSELGGFARGTKATNLCAFGSLLKLADFAASAAEGVF